MKRVCIIVNDFTKIGGTEQVVCNLTKLLYPYYEITIVSLFGKVKDIPYDLIHAKKVVCLYPKKEKFRRALVKYRKMLPDFLKQGEYDKVLLEGIEPGIISVIQCYKKIEGEIIYCDHDGLKNQWKNIRTRILKYMGAKRSDKVITLTKSVKQEYIDMFHLKKEKVFNIYNSMDQKLLDKRGSYNLNSHAIVSVIRLEKEKGCDLLLKTAEIVLSRNRQLTWHIYGDGTKRKGMEDYVKQFSWGNRLYFHGFENDKSEMYSEKALFVLTSYREGFSLVLIEAQAFELPSISFNVKNGPDEIIIDKVNGFLIPPYDYQMMAEKILELMSDNEKRAEFASHSKDQIDKFNESTICEEWRQVLG